MAEPASKPAFFELEFLDAELGSGTYRTVAARVSFAPEAANDEVPVTIDEDHEEAEAVVVFTSLLWK